MSDHEKTDARIELLPWVVATFVVVLIVVFVSVWWIFRFYWRLDASRDTRRTLIQEPAPIPPEPRLQIDPEVDLQRFRAEQARTLSSYGWASPTEQRVRIPIDRAMEMVIQGKQP
jgi:hypothetical protein